MQAWAAALNDETDDDNDEMEELEDFPKHPDENGAPMDAFDARCDVIAMIADETRKDTAAMVTESTNGTVEDTIADVIQGGCMTAKEGIKAPIFHLIEEALIDVVQ